MIYEKNSKKITNFFQKYEKNKNNDFLGLRKVWNKWVAEIRKIMRKNGILLNAINGMSRLMKWIHFCFIDLMK